MPAYPGATGAIVPVISSVSGMTMNPGDSQYLFGTLASTATQLPVNDGNVAFETVTVGEASISVHLSRKEMSSPPAVSLEVIFNGNPGTFEIDLQEASGADADGRFLTVSGSVTKITTATQVGSNWIAFIDDIPAGGGWVRAYVKSFQNAATVGMLCKLRYLN